MEAAEYELKNAPLQIDEFVKDNQRIPSENVQNLHAGYGAAAAPASIAGCGSSHALRAR